MLATSIGFIGELYTGFKDGKFAHLHNAQHMTMFAFFFLNGVADLLVHYDVDGVPEGLDYLSGAFALTMEGMEVQC